MIAQPAPVSQGCEATGRGYDGSLGSPGADGPPAALGLAQRKALCTKGIFFLKRHGSEGETEAKYQGTFTKL